MCRSYAERDKYAADMDKLREELERVQVGIFWFGLEKIYMLWTWTNMKKR
jgi:hypothetical protein